MKVETLHPTRRNPILLKQQENNPFEDGNAASNLSNLVPLKQQESNSSEDGIAVSDLSKFGFRETARKQFIKMKLSTIITLLILMIALPFPVQAQSGFPRVNPGENVLGEVTLENPGPRFEINIPANKMIRLQVQSLHENFAPMIVVYDALDRVVQREENPIEAVYIDLYFRTEADTIFRVQVLGAGGHQGDFVLSLVEALDDSFPIIDIPEPRTFKDFVTPNTPVKRYLFSAQRELSLVVEVVSDLPDGGIALILRDAQGSTLATARASMLGGAFLIPAATGVQYELVVIHSGAERREPYTLSLRPYQSAQTLVITPWQPTQTATESISQNTPTRTANAFASFTPTPVETRVEIDTPAASATQLPPITPSAPAPTATEFTPVELPAFGDCIATPAGARGVNVRRGPGTEYEITSGLNPGEVMPVTGHSEAFDWWQVEYREGTYGWVADIAVQVGGDCSTIGVAPYPTQESISSVTAVPLATEEGDLAE